jgi:cvfA/B/C family virulence factor
VARYQILYWKDIPAQVRVFPETGRPISRQLPERFQQEIDARAMSEGLAGTDDYLEQWHWSEKQERDLPAAELLEALVRELTGDS